MIPNKLEFPAYPQNGIYLDSATIGLPHHSVIDAITRFFNEYSSIPNKLIYQRSRETLDIYLDTKEKISKLLRLSEENLAFTSNHDLVWNLVIQSFIKSHNSKTEKLHVISSIYDDHAVIVPLINQKEYIDLDLMQVHENQQVLEYLETHVKSNTLVILSHVSPILGNNSVIYQIAGLIRDKGGKMGIDISRSIMQNPLDLQKIRPDICVFDGSIDLLGPQGIAILYLETNLLKTLQNPYPGSGSISSVTATHITQLSSISKFETGNINMYGVIGIATAINNISLWGRENIIKHRKQINNRIRKNTSMMTNLNILTPYNSSNSILTFTIENTQAHDISLLLDELNNIEIRSGMLCAHPGLDMFKQNEVLQISTHLYNSVEDIDIFFESLQTLPVFD